jgi:hypothetical protein
VILGSQRVQLREALFNAIKDKDRGESTNPLVENGEKLIPSVTRVFRRNQNLLVYLQAYEQEAANVQPLVAFVSLFHGPKKVLDTSAIKVAEGINNRLKTVPLEFSVPLKNIPADEYECQVTVLNPDGQKAAFWRAPIVVIE